MDYQAPDPTIAKLEMPWKSCDVEIWGSFNGVLLVSIDEELRLWNPSIGMYQKISPPGRSSFTIAYGLGYDSINDDFKVVGVVPPIRDSMQPYGPRTAHVFSSKLSSWKSIGDCDYHCVDFNRTARKVVSRILSAAVFRKGWRGCTGVAVRGIGAVQKEEVGEVFEASDLQSKTKNQEDWDASRLEGV
ncbi:hypothetical protein RHSIM_Rhsim04G0210900 [Rhododendron simsii]|uniref:F-box associated beta-propeller type 3 domain-containing protein n=1 Tax=Rhododendron simsii TaxID=118357 RepID=A0A834H012_RHOSS|nr:hypothetical protein RHSIM_Rhsim04G0210900 [Rhododendron simsii]